MSLLGLLVLLVTVSGCLAHWHNDFDGPLNFQCHSDSYAVTRIKSIHSNHYEDRRFEIGCTRVSFSSRRKSCYWTNYVNNFDERIQFTCKSNHFINGMSSYHNNHYEDRIWKFRCCAIAARPLQDCTLTGWTNSWDNRQDYSVPSGHVIKGVVSEHSNHYEDRRYEYLVCKLGVKKGDRDEEARPTTLLDYLKTDLRADESHNESLEDSVDGSKGQSQEESVDESYDGSLEESEVGEPREDTLLYYPGQESRDDSEDLI